MQIFVPQNVQKFVSDEATDWMEYSGFSLADVVNEDEAPQAKLGALGFTRSRKGRDRLSGVAARWGRRFGCEAEGGAAPEETPLPCRASPAQGGD